MNSKDQKQFILDEVLEWAGNEEKALNWYHNEILPAFQLTPEQIIKRNKFSVLKRYIESIRLGGYS
jgi:hypothetical protein